MSIDNPENEIKAIIGLGNPGAKYHYTRHNIGFRILDSLIEKYSTSWKSIDKMEIAEIQINDKNVLLVKPLTTMNISGQVIPFLQKKGIKAENLLVVHDELELPFGIVKFKLGGSSKGHNGLKSIISFIGENFARLRIGIGRPQQKEEVANYVLHNFSPTESKQLEEVIYNSINEIEKII